MKNSLSILLGDSLTRELMNIFDLSLSKNNRFLHLGCSDGRLAFKVAKLVGSGGKVIGIESDPAVLRDVYGMMSDVADDLGYDNMYFYHGQNHELRTDVYRQSTLFKRLKMDNFSDFSAFTHRSVEYFNNNPVVVSHSIDVLFSSIDLGQLAHFQIVELFHEAARVLNDKGVLFMLTPSGSSMLEKNIEQYEQILSGSDFESINFFNQQFEQSNCCGTEQFKVIRAVRNTRKSSVSNVSSESSCSGSSCC